MIIDIKALFFAFLSNKAKIVKTKLELTIINVIKQNTKKYITFRNGNVIPVRIAIPKIQ